MNPLPSGSDSSSAKGKKPAKKPQKPKESSMSQSPESSSDMQPYIRRRAARRAAEAIATTATETKQMYDDQGKLVETGEDLCDCTNVRCPGCFFPCTKCGNTKCGTRCRVRRSFKIDSVEAEGFRPIPPQSSTVQHQNKKQ